MSPLKRAAEHAARENNKLAVHVALRRGMNRRHIRLCKDAPKRRLRPLDPLPYWVWPHFALACEREISKELSEPESGLVARIELLKGVAIDEPSEAVKNLPALPAVCG